MVKFGSTTDPARTFHRGERDVFTNSSISGSWNCHGICSRGDSVQAGAACIGLLRGAAESPPSLLFSVYSDLDGSSQRSSYCRNDLLWELKERLISTFADLEVTMVAKRLFTLRRLVIGLTVAVFVLYYVSRQWNVAICLPGIFLLVIGAGYFLEKFSATFFPVRPGIIEDDPTTEWLKARLNKSRRPF